MAIRVIKHGYQFLRATCPRCKCEFEFLETDMETYGNQMESYEVINCPDCGHRITWWYGEKSGRQTIHAQPYK